ncbi:hypothetical protein cypCar_00019120 [Cyprinus carpio]|nr:hypothetical protein cypCar_00019120 [Cyprinus carpio]
MSHYRRSGPRLHRHCETCYSRRYKASIEVHVMHGVSFHLCKEDEHSLLCPNENVPCLNAHYGCPFTMCRSRLSKHLEVCPASVICCSMEWNRWPLENPDAPLYTNLLKELHEQESLDLSMALRDQKHLCARLKMRSCFPELMEEQEEEPAPVEKYDIEEGAVGKCIVCDGMHINGHGGSGGGLVNGPSKACQKALKEYVVLNGPVDKEK